MKTFNKITAVVLTAASILAPVAFVNAQTTTLGAICDTAPSVSTAYDINYGTFTAAEVATSTVTKTGDSGTLTVSNPCGEDRSLTISYTDMTGADTGDIVGPAQHYLEATSYSVVGLQSDVVDPTTIHTPMVAGDDVVLMSDNDDDGEAGDHTIGLDHEIIVPQNQAVDLYTGLVELTI